MVEVPPEPPIVESAVSQGATTRAASPVTPDATPAASGKKRWGMYTFMFFVGIPSALFWLGLLLFLLIATALFGNRAVQGGDTYACNVARIQLHGVLMVSEASIGLFENGSITDVDSFTRIVADATHDDSIIGIVLDVNSPGGTPSAGDEMLDVVLGVEKPVAAVVREMGASAAYWAIAGSDYIVASPVSDVGSIGVTMSYAESAGTLQEEGGRWVDIASGDFKDAGHPERELREEEQEYLQSQVDSVHVYMMERILSARPVLVRETLEAVADGRAFLGADALEYGLVDEVGSFAEALQYIENETGKRAVLCEVKSPLLWW